MDRGEDCKFLATALADLHARSYAALRQLVNQPAAAWEVRIGTENVQIEIAVFWKDKKARTLEVCATAMGPSTWKIDRLTESFVVGPTGIDAGDC